MPAVGPLGITVSNKAPSSERTHEENQERAYIAASRRGDRSLEARVESARRASEIHKRRTGRSLRVTEQDVVNEEMYEEEEDDDDAMARIGGHAYLNRHRPFPFSSTHQSGFINPISQALHQRTTAAVNSFPAIAAPTSAPSDASKLNTMVQHALPPSYERLSDHLKVDSGRFDRRLTAFLANQVAMRSAVDQAITRSYAQQYPNAPQFAHNQLHLTNCEFRMPPHQSQPSEISPEETSASIQPVDFKTVEATDAGSAKASERTFRALPKSHKKVQTDQTSKADISCADHNTSQQQQQQQQQQHATKKRKAIPPSHISIPPPLPASMWQSRMSNRTMAPVQGKKHESKDLELSNVQDQTLNGVLHPDNGPTTYNNSATHEVSDSLVAAHPAQATVSGMEYNPLSSTLPLDAQMLLRGNEALNMDDPFTRAMMHGFEATPDSYQMPFREVNMANKHVQDCSPPSVDSTNSVSSHCSTTSSLSSRLPDISRGQSISSASSLSTASFTNYSKFAADRAMFAGYDMSSTLAPNIVDRSTLRQLQLQQQLQQQQPLQQCQDAKDSITALDNSVPQFDFEPNALANPPQVMRPSMSSNLDPASFYPDFEIPLSNSANSGTRNGPLTPGFAGVWDTYINDASWNENIA